jgi:hypothetical protein
MTDRQQTNLRTVKLPVVLNTSESDIIQDFFIPALSNSTRYDRGVGFFSAAWLRLAAKGMINFATNSGRARWVTSPILGEKDWLAMEQGEAARHDVVLRQVLAESIDDLEKSLTEDTLSALAWMIADGILDFKLALPRNKLQGGEFHDKDDIVWSLLQDHFSQLSETLQAELPVQTLNRHQQKLRLIFDYAAKERDLLAVMLSDRGHITLTRRFTRYIATIIKADIEKGLTPHQEEVPIDFKANYLAGALLQVLTWWLENDNNLSPRNLADMFYKQEYPTDYSSPI